jgi:capsular polysaccharide biosynthesis protein
MQVVDARARGALATLPNPRDRAIAPFVESLTLAPTHTLMVKRGIHYLKVHEHEVGPVVNGRSSTVTVEVVARRSKGVLTSGTRVHGAPARYASEFATVVPFPPATVRDYAGPVTVGPKGLVYADGLILPEAFRYPHEPRLKNAATRDVDRAFARIPPKHLAVKSLPGTYFHLDPYLASHFGHLMLESVSRLWGWEHARERHPDAKVIFRTKSPGDRFSTLERALLGAYGIAASDIVFVDRPVRVDRLVGASPLLHYSAPYTVNPSIKATWERIGDALVDPHGSLAGDRIFVSRKPGRTNRECRNAPTVEEFFRQRGFTVLYPEDLSLNEQATAFAHARVIAGFGGSAMLSLVYARRVETVIVLSQEGYTARNEHLISLLLDCDVHYLWSKGDVEHPEDGWRRDAFFSAWDFDWEQNEVPLRELLAAA